VVGSWNQGPMDKEGLLCSLNQGLMEGHPNCSLVQFIAALVKHVDLSPKRCTRRKVDINTKSKPTKASIL
jgi:hypothetical protein